MLAKEQSQLGDTPIETQLSHARLADMYTAASATRSFLYATAAAADNGLLLT